MTWKRVNFFLFNQQSRYFVQLSKKDYSLTVRLSVKLLDNVVADRPEIPLKHKLWQRQHTIKLNMNHLWFVAWMFCLINTVYTQTLDIKDVDFAVIHCDARSWMIIISIQPHNSGLCIVTFAHYLQLFVWDSSADLGLNKSILTCGSILILRQAL